MAGRVLSPSDPLMDRLMVIDLLGVFNTLQPNGINVKALLSGEQKEWWHRKMEGTTSIHRRNPNLFSQELWSSEHKEQRHRKIEGIDSIHGEKPNLFPWEEGIAIIRNKKDTSYLEGNTIR